MSSTQGFQGRNNSGRGQISHNGGEASREGKAGGSHKKKKNRRRNHHNNKKRGATGGRDIQMFKDLSERPKLGQFRRALEDLKRHASNKHSDVYYMLDRCLFENLETPTLPKPVLEDILKDIPDEQSKYKDIFLEAELEHWMETKNNLDSALTSLYGEVWSRCSSILRFKLETSEGYKSAEKRYDVARLLREIKVFSMKFSTLVSPYVSLDEAYRNLCLYRQKPYESLDTYMDNFNDLMEVIEYNGGNEMMNPIGYAPLLVEYERSKDKDNAQSDEYYAEKAKNRMIAVMFLLRSDRKQYGHLLNTLRNDFASGNDLYPHTLNEAYLLLHRFLYR